MDLLLQYLTDLVVVHRPVRALRSADTLLLHTPKSRLCTYGDRAFSIAAANLWNVLTHSLRATDTESSFRKGLKTYLFRQAYE